MKDYDPATVAEKKRVTEARRFLAGHQPARSKKRPHPPRTPGAIEQRGQDLLDIRRAAGKPDPGGREWAERMKKYHLGTLALLKAATQPGFTADQVPDKLRRWLTHPIHDRPATDDDLRAIVTIEALMGLAHEEAHNLWEKK